MSTTTQAEIDQAKLQQFGIPQSLNIDAVSTNPLSQSKKRKRALMSGHTSEESDTLSEGSA